VAEHVDTEAFLRDRARDLNESTRAPTPPGSPRLRRGGPERLRRCGRAEAPSGKYSG